MRTILVGGTEMAAAGCSDVMVVELMLKRWGRSNTLSVVFDAWSIGMKSFVRGSMVGSDVDGAMHGMYA